MVRRLAYRSGVGKENKLPPPPKEVAWNPTIESNLPYKEVKYFKFVEGAGWQALNIGEILPVLFWVGSLIVLIVK